VGEGAIESVLEARKEGGPFESLFDFCERVDHSKVNRRVVESLIKCGAFDATGTKRSQMMFVLEEAVGIGQKIQRDRTNGQFSLFEVMADKGQEVIYPPIPEMKEWDESQLLNYEKESLGFFITGHPLARYEAILKKFSNTDTAQLKELSDRAVVRLGGLVRDYKPYNDKKGDRMAFVTLEDLSGFVEVTLFSSLYSNVSNLIEKDTPIFVEGHVTRDEKSVKVLGELVIPIEKAEETWTTSIRLNLDATTLDKEVLRELHDILEKHKGTCNAFLHLRMPQRTETIIALPDHIRLRTGKALTEEVNRLLGYGAVETVCQNR
jgi:DNA polymerase-3 subunit alpha